MDQKKTLWIVTAAGFFLAVVVLAALILNKPSPTQIPSTASVTIIEKPIEKSIETESQEIQQPETNLIESETISNLGEVDSAQNSQENLAQTENSNPSVVIDLNQVNNVVIQPETSVTPKNQVTQEAIEEKKQSEKTTTIYTASAAEKRNFEYVAKSNKKDVAEQKNKYSKNNNKNYVSASKNYESDSFVQSKYWIQCASYSSKKTAEGARSALDKNKIPVEVFTFKDSKNNLYYRVRVGPYTTKSEAEYWQSRIAKIDNFKNANSFITIN